MEKLIRLVMLFSLIYIFPFPGYGPSLLSNIAFTTMRNSIPQDDENGMGMLYSENVSLVLPGADAGSGIALAGMAEPDVYSKPQMLLSFSYKIRQGDTVGALAQTYGLNPDTLLSVNNIKNSRLIQIDQMLRIPNQDGIVHTVKEGDTLVSIAERYDADTGSILTANELFSETINAGTSLFIPGVRLSQTDLQEINGDLFMWPVRGYITSPYGYRPSPFTRQRQFHTGLDIGAPQGASVRAGMAGRVSSVGFDGVSGNYVVITHHSGYRTLYAHLSVIRTMTGAYVRGGDVIGDVGSTGLSTGPHLHFTVYKNGVTVNPRSLIR
ncbi:MAG: M23 family metallopeptidase [Treponema sp.]|jgi:murein DD-endopeptidase MepM/ murein hydrolase activator NlpD|nr:M23 family metallopeptidase [Treponema sp.]